MKKLEVVVLTEGVHLSGKTVEARTRKVEQSVVHAGNQQQKVKRNDDPFFKIESPRAQESSLVTVTTCL